MTVKEIIINHLKNIGADGLCNENCGCGIDDLQPCCEDFSTCVPAKRVKCDVDCEHEGWGEGECFQEFNERIEK